jgi:cytochrome oxidase Cu insertion factor (SCO1/SenC/PrrC family)
MTRLKSSISGLVRKPQGLRIAVIAVLFLAGLSPFARGQENQPATNHTAVGLELGQQAPAFVLSDQFGHEHSNQTLKGSRGTVLLFFRSADW